MIDDFQREISYLRISVTDRCNLRCRYCMPPEGIPSLPMEEILTFEETARICRAAAQMGISRIKITGGEPLVRKGLPDLIRRISAIPGIRQVTLTTNGVLLADQLPDLMQAGISAVNISLDSLNPDRYREITGSDALGKVLTGLRVAIKSGIRTKVNAVLCRELHKDALDLLILAEHYPVDVRFIELMPIGLGRDYEGLSGTDFLAELKALYPGMTRDETCRGNGPAVYYRVPGFKGSIGFINAIHDKFCDRCNRMRLTSTGQLKPCLCYGEGIDLRAILRGTDAVADAEGVQLPGSAQAAPEGSPDSGGYGHTDSISGGADDGMAGASVDAALLAAFRQAAAGKPGEHCFEAQAGISETKKMVMIGG